MKKNYYTSYLFAILGMIAAIFFDQFTKILAVKHLKNENPINIVKNVFQLHYLENRGASFWNVTKSKDSFCSYWNCNFNCCSFMLYKTASPKTFPPIENLSAFYCFRSNREYD